MLARGRPLVMRTVLVVAVLLTAAGRTTSRFTLGITGDVNLNPHLGATTSPEFVWGDTLAYTRSTSLMAIQHESTLAEVKDDDPETIQFEDPLNYTATYAVAGIDFITIANNHQFDFGYAGLTRTQQTLAATGIPFGGVGASASAVRTPVVVPAQPTANTVPVAFFSIVVDECWRWPNGTLYLDGCTCGPSANPSHDPPYQCYEANETHPGLWYHFGITDAFIQEVSSTVGKYKDAHPEQLVVAYLHVGPNFQWNPYPEREHLLRNISEAGADLVWGTSSHHVQRFEVHRGTPIVYGLGDFLFRHVVGVEDWCPLYARPCEAYRPDLSLMYIFDIEVEGGRPRVNLSSITAVPTKHNDNATAVASDAVDLAWLGTAFDKQAIGASLVRNGAVFDVKLSSPVRQRRQPHSITHP
eukprot:m.278413 g.278413  ORF g.278413 m.278413 type:complete len:413 (+) comp26946_c0_seq6:456-1694(+)